jgi:hypothetical protein
MILGVAIGAGAYGALVNAIGFYVLEKFYQWNLASKAAVKPFEELYLSYIGYDVAQLELINGATTFFIGIFLIAGISHQFIKISLSSDSSLVCRGLFIRNIFCVFLWLTVAGFIFVFFITIADAFGLFKSKDCAANTVCSIYGIQWILRLLGYPEHSTAALSPLEIYVGSAIRIVPFLIPALVPPLRAGLNVAADVLLYILPNRFPLSLKLKAQTRFAELIRGLHASHPNADISILAHSQGTVIVRDVLGNSNLSAR